MTDEIHPDGLPDAAALPRHARDRHRHHHGGARRHGGERRAAEHRPRARRHALGGGLDRQRLPARDRRARSCRSRRWASGSATGGSTRSASWSSPSARSPARCRGSLPQLLAARVLQGLGGAAIMSMNGALVRHTYPDAHARPRHRPERPRRLHRRRGGAVARLRHPRRRPLALALRGQRAVRPPQPLARAALPAALRDLAPALRLDERAAQRRDVRPLLRRRRRASTRGGGGLAGGRRPRRRRGGRRGRWSGAAPGAGAADPASTSSATRSSRCR